MTFAGYVFGGYALTAVAVGWYAARVLRRGRKLAEQVPVEEQPWR